MGVGGKCLKVHRGGERNGFFYILSKKCRLILRHDHTMGRP